MKKHFFLLFTILVFTGTQGYAQFGYTQYQSVDGLKISTKWGKARDESGTKRPALLMAFENTNNFPVAYSFDILLYYEGILRENGRMEDLCLDALKSNIGKLNGIYFIPENFTEDQLKNADFNFEIDNLEVEKIENCMNIEEE